MTTQHGSKQGPSIEILDGKNALDALEPEWTELCGHAADHHCSQTVYWARHAWTYVARRGGHRLRILAGRDHGRLVLVWPLVIRNHLAWRQADWLGSGYEYRDVLIDRDVGREEWIDAAWSVITSELGVDLFRCNLMAPDAAAFPLLQRQDSARVWQTPALYVPVDRWRDWRTASRDMKAKVLANRKRRRQRLSERGQVTFEFPNQLDEVDRVIGWMLDHKRAWARRKGVPAVNLKSEAYQRFLGGVAKDALLAGDLLLGVLRVDDRIIAAKLSFVRRSHMELYLGTYDREWHAYGPGLLLLDELVKLAFEKRLSRVDFRIGLEPYKREYSVDEIQVSGYVVPCSPWGACYTAWHCSPLRAAMLHGYRLLPTAVQGALKSRRPG